MEGAPGPIPPIIIVPEMTFHPLVVIVFLRIPIGFRFSIEAISFILLSAFFFRLSGGAGGDGPLIRSRLRLSGSCSTLRFC